MRHEHDGGRAGAAGEGEEARGEVGRVCEGTRVILMSTAPPHCLNSHIGTGGPINLDPTLISLKQEHILNSASFQTPAY